MQSETSSLASDINSFVCDVAVFQVIVQIFFFCEILDQYDHCV